MVILSVIVGLAVLLLGRRLFWVFLAAVGFILGFNYAPQLFHVESPAVILLIAVVAGVLGAALALLLKEVALAVGGFLAGGYIALEYFKKAETTADIAPWIIYLIGGFLGALLLFLIFDWALIVLSSFLGAAIIVEALVLRSPWPIILFVGLTLVGIIVQAGWMLSERRRVPIL